MTVVVSVEEAASHLPELLLRLSSDALEIVIAQDGTPIARLLPAQGLRETARPRRTPGGDRGLFTVPAEFFEPLPEDLLDSIYDDARP